MKGKRRKGSRAGRRRRGGVIARLGKVEGGRKRAPRLPRPLRLGLGVVAGLAGVVALLFLARIMFDPTLRPRRGTAVVEVVRVEAGTEGEPAEAVVEIEEHKVRVRLVGPGAGEVRAGSRLEVHYTVLPGGGRIRVDRWRLVASPQ